MFKWLKDLFSPKNPDVVEVSFKGKPKEDIRDYRSKSTERKPSSKTISRESSRTEQPSVGIDFSESEEVSKIWYPTAVSNIYSSDSSSSHSSSHSHSDSSSSSYDSGSSSGGFD